MQIIKFIFLVGVCVYTSATSLNPNLTLIHAGEKSDGQVGSEEEILPTSRYENHDYYGLHGWEPCTVLRDPVLGSISTHLPDPATRPPQSCKDYEISREFIPSTNISAIEGANDLFKAGMDLDGGKLYICKALINGVEFLGRGSISDQITKCWLDLGTHEVLIGDDFSYLRKPQGVRLLWKNKNAGGVEMGLNPIGNSEGNNNGRWIGRTIFQTPVKNQKFSECVTSTEDGKELLIPGFVEWNNPTKLRFTFGSKIYTSQDFMVLTCADLKRNL